MDSLTQAVLGASVAGTCAPAGHRRRALLAGAALGTLPDLDVFIDYGDAVRNFTFHRGFSHSLFVLPAFGTGLWLLLRRFWAPVRESPQRWLIAILLTLMTHPLLDAHTAYGTQILWPLESPPVAWSTIFIIDPLYTLPLLTGVIAAWFARRHPRRMAAIGLGLSSLYLAWTWTAKGMLGSVVDETLQALGVPDAAVFTTPSPFNTLSWRVVVLTGDGYLEGHYSFLADNGKLRLTPHSFDRDLITDSEHLWAARRLRWFAQDFVSAEQVDGELVYTDLRMGETPVYVFRHVIAENSGDDWEPVATRRLTVDIDSRQLGEVWRGIWRGR